MAAVLSPIYSYTDTTTKIKSVADEIVMTDPKSAPLLRTLSPNLDNMSPAAISDPHYWVEDTLQPVACSLAADIDTTSATTMTVTSGYGEYFRKGMLVQVDSELFVVGTTTDASKAADTIVIGNRGFGYTTAATHNTNVDVYLVGHTGIESESSWDGFQTTPTMPYNQFQVMYEPLEVGMVQQATQHYGVDDPVALLEDKALIHLMKLLNRNLYYGTRSALAASTPGGFGGFMDTTAAFIDSTHRSNQSSVALAEATIEGAMQTCFEDVGDEYLPTLLVCNMFQKRKISAMWESKARIERGENTIGLVIDRIETDAGPLDVLVDYHCPTSRVFLLNPSFIQFGPLRGNGKDLSFAWYEPANTKISSLRVLWGAYSMVMKAPKAHFEIYGLTTS